MNKSRLSQILIILILFIPTLNHTFSSVEFTNKSYKEIMNPFPSNSWDLTGTRIIIDNNWSATASAHDWCSGSGTINNPYIIENVTIDGLGHEFCVLITNSSVHFVIRNSNFFNTAINSSNYDNSGGIVLYNVSNGQVINNVFSFNDIGIVIFWGSYNNSISQNRITNNNVGIFFMLSSFGSGLNGVGIFSWGYNNLISKNLIRNNNVGILYSAWTSIGRHNTITENNITHNSVGIDGHGGGVQISSNNVSYNENYGIYLRSTYNFSITKNVINYNYGKGIFLDDQFWYNTISKNEINNNKDEGIYLKGNYHRDRYGELRASPVRNYILISENTVNNNSYGIKLNATDSNQIINNFVNYNQNDGISLQLSDLNNFLNNTVNNNDIGINMVNGISNDVVANILNDNERYGINLDYTDFTTILSNTVTNNYIGINVSNSKRNDIFNNEINNNQYGIYFTNTRLNAVINNTLLHNVKCFVKEGSNVENTFKDNECKEVDNFKEVIIIITVIFSVCMICLVGIFWFIKARSGRN